MVEKYDNNSLSGGVKYKAQGGGGKNLRSCRRLSARKRDAAGSQLCLLWITSKIATDTCSNMSVSMTFNDLASRPAVLRGELYSVNLSMYTRTA